MRLHRLLAWVLLAPASACRAQAGEPAPPPASYELTVAPPGARGARAAGTDAAPPAPSQAELAAPGTDDDEPESEEDGGTASDAGTAPDAAPGVAL
jgi:hypothetical protein